ncbi:MAG: PD40 domain-containing protein [Planctomycetes bacterium]|nr:PD40 domain-containing protein [Planctomycetota bacterium]
MYSSTKAAGDVPPPPPDRSAGYRWPLYREFDLYVLDPNSGAEQRLTQTDGYDAEATVSPDGKRLVFMSHRDGVFGLTTMNVDGTDLRKVEQPRCYTGGPFFSPDGRWLVFRSFYPETPQQEQELDRMLAERALIPFRDMVIEIYVSRPDGSERRRITATGKINFAPIFHPDGKRILFCSSMEAKHRGGYSLWLINADGTGLERVTFHEASDKHPGFDGFPCFSPDGRRLAWISNRGENGLNVFLAEWRD